MQAFRISAISRDGVCTFIVSGEVDLDVAPEIADLGILSLNDPTIDVLVVDLGAVTFMDSTGLGALVSIRSLALAFGKHLSVTNIPGRIKRLMYLTGLDSVFCLQPQEQATA